MGLKYVYKEQSGNRLFAGIKVRDTLATRWHFFLLKGILWRSVKRQKLNEAEMEVKSNELPILRPADLGRRALLPTNAAGPVSGRSCSIRASSASKM